MMRDTFEDSYKSPIVPWYLVGYSQETRFVLSLLKVDRKSYTTLDD